MLMGVLMVVAFAWLIYATRPTHPKRQCQVCHERAGRHAVVGGNWDEVVLVCTECRRRL